MERNAPTPSSKYSLAFHGEHGAKNGYLEHARTQGSLVLTSHKAGAALITGFPHPLCKVLQLLPFEAALDIVAAVEPGADLSNKLGEFFVLLLSQSNWQCSEHWAWERSGEWSELIKEAIAYGQLPESVTIDRLLDLAENAAHQITREELRNTETRVAALYLSVASGLALYLAQTRQRQVLIETCTSLTIAYDAANHLAPPRPRTCPGMEIPAGFPFYKREASALPFIYDHLTIDAAEFLVEQLLSAVYYSAYFSGTTRGSDGAESEAADAVVAERQRMASLLLSVVSGAAVQAA